MRVSRATTRLNRARERINLICKQGQGDQSGALRAIKGRGVVGGREASQRYTMDTHPPPQGVRTTTVGGGRASLLQVQTATENRGHSSFGLLHFSHRALRRWSVYDVTILKFMSITWA